MTEPNDNFDTVVVLMIRYFQHAGMKFLPGQQFKWAMKKLVPKSSDCGCKKSYYRYLLTHDVNGIKLPSSVWVHEEFLEEDEDIRPQPAFTYWEDRRGDRLTECNQDQLQPHERQFGTGYTGPDGYAIINEGYLPATPST